MPAIARTWPHRDCLNQADWWATTQDYRCKIRVAVGVVPMWSPGFGQYADLVAATVAWAVACAVACTVAWGVAIVETAVATAVAGDVA